MLPVEEVKISWGKKEILFSPKRECFVQIFNSEFHILIESIPGTPGDQFLGLGVSETTFLRDAFRKKRDNVGKIPKWAAPPSMGISRSQKK